MPPVDGHLQELHSVVHGASCNFLLLEHKEFRVMKMDLTQSFISIAETAAKQQARQLNTASNNETQPKSKPLMLNGIFNRLI